ncbi:MAG: hypothetical protein ACFE9I_04125 [Candidatus Hermodarchaeota archaeon]
MSKKNSSSLNAKFKIQINNLITIYEQKAECGIFFKLDQEKTPLEILGVLDFLKYKIKKWGNANLFSYQGTLFKRNIILVVGARDFEEAISIMIYMFLSNIVENDFEINNLIKFLGNSLDIEQYLRNEFLEQTEKGYPKDADLELELINHLKNFFKNNQSNI